MINSVRPTRVEVNLKDLSHNLKSVREVVGNRKIMGIVKANAYGHGLVGISRHLEKENVDYLGVAFIEEAILLRNANIQTPILVLGGIDNHQIEMFLENDISITGSSIEKLEAISTEAKKLNKTAKVHLKVDTGMGRIGVQWDRVEPFLKEAFELPNIDIEGIFSHFASSSLDLDLTKKQLDRFNAALEALDKYADRKKLIIHLTDSGGIANNLKDSFFDMVRTGLSLYGYSPIKSFQNQLKPIMAFKTKVSYFKVLGKGSTVGYDNKYITKKMTRIVTLPVGYADGYARSLSNKGRVIIKGKEYPIAGRICMDQCMVDIGPKGDAYNGDDVLLWGSDCKNSIDLWEVSKLADRSIYDMLTGVSQRVPTVYID
ncbi:MAG: alanine racemase [Candidatus Dojkabacteria bacterium]|jgi:alanine racemase|nr:alanine racemase [Candidatus Dojkabacteria bacterium]MDD2270511.1 alanine racemase [Candidatus Dojkabacteria bacterium]